MPRRRRRGARGGRGLGGGGLLLLILIVVGVLYALPRLRAGVEQPDEQQTFPTVPTPPGGAAGPLAAAPRPTPQAETYKGCPAGGDGTDPELNALKNRIDPVPSPAAASVDALLNLAWPPGVNQKHMAQWSAADRAEVARSNGAGVMVEAYVIRVAKEGPESPNCHATADSDVDYHEWIVANPTDDRPKSVVVEVTPRLRARHPGWTLVNFQKLAQSKARVRVTGWVMLDPEHPDQVGKTRGTIWEIHPVTKVEVFQNGQWVDLDTQR